MRRSDREVTDVSDIISIMRECDVCRLAINDGDVPYIVPLNFGMKVDGLIVTLYFHSAPTGKKIDLLRRHGVARFEMDCAHELKSDVSRGYCTMKYKSVIGVGSVEFIEDEQEKISALELICGKYHSTEFKFNREAVPKTAVFKLTVSEMTGKARR